MVNPTTLPPPPKKVPSVSQIVIKISFLLHTWADTICSPTSARVSAVCCVVYQSFREHPATKTPALYIQGVIDRNAGLEMNKGCCYCGANQYMSCLGDTSIPSNTYSEYKHRPRRLRGGGWGDHGAKGRRSAWFSPTSSPGSAPPLALVQLHLQLCVQLHLQLHL